MLFPPENLGIVLLTVKWFIFLIEGLLLYNVLFITSKIRGVGFLKNVIYDDRQNDGSFVYYFQNVFHMASVL